MRSITPCLKLGLLFLNLAVKQIGVDISNLIPTCKDEYLSLLINDITKASFGEKFFMAADVTNEKLNSLLDEKMKKHVI